MNPQARREKTKPIKEMKHQFRRSREIVYFHSFTSFPPAATLVKVSEEREDCLGDSSFTDRERGERERAPQKAKWSKENTVGNDWRERGYLTVLYHYSSELIIRFLAYKICNSNKNYCFQFYLR